MKGPWMRTATVLAALALVMTVTACGSSSSSSSGSEGGGGSQGDFRVGLEAPLSGEQAVLGRGMLRGAQLAATQLNESGGILGRQVQIVPIDDAADPETGVKAAKKAIAEG